MKLEGPRHALFINLTHGVLGFLVCMIPAPLHSMVNGMGWIIVYQKPSVEQNMMETGLRIGISPSVTGTANRTRQIDFGWFTIFQGNAEVGKVCVLSAATEARLFGTGGMDSLNRSGDAFSHATLPSRSVEHWWLLPNYQAPSSENPTVVLTFIRDEDSTTTDESAAFQMLSTSMTQRGAQYVRAECVLGASPESVRAAPRSSEPGQALAAG